MNVAKPFLLACNEPSRCFPNIRTILATTLNKNKKRVLPLRCKSLCLPSNGDWLEVPKEVENEEEFIVVNFYRFVFIEDPEEEVSKHLSFLEVTVYTWILIIWRFLTSTHFSMYISKKPIYMLFQSDIALWLQGRDIHGRIYLNKQGINAQVGLFVFFLFDIPLLLPFSFVLWAFPLLNHKIEFHGSTWYYYSVESSKYWLFNVWWEGTCGVVF